MNTKEFPIDELILMTCGVMEITEDDYYSDSKERRASVSRQIVTVILKEKGFSPREVSDLTGFSEPRIINSIHSFNRYAGKYLHKLEQIKQRFNEVYFTPEA